MKRKEAVEILESYMGIINSILNVPVRLNFDAHSIECIISKVYVEKVSDLKIKPLKEKFSNPSIIGFEMDSGDKLQFILEDIEIVSISNGIRIITGYINVDIVLR